MLWLNLRTSVLHAPEFIGCDPTRRATWLAALLWSVEQENGGRIVGAAKWSDRRWQQTAGVTLQEVQASAPLLVFDGADLMIWSYPSEQEEIMRTKRAVAIRNGQLGGRPFKAPVEEKPMLEPTLVSMLEPTLEPTSETVKKGNGKGKGMKSNLAPAAAAAGVPTSPRPAKPRQRDPLFDGLARACGMEPAQMTKRALGACGVALAEIRTASPGVQPDDFTRRAAIYRRKWSAPLTPSALCSQWAACAPAPVMPVAPTVTPALAPIPEPAGDWRALVAADPGLAQYIGANEPWAQIERFWQKEIDERMNDPTQPKRTP